MKKAKDPYRLVGTVLATKYELEEYAGGGGMGAVYRARRVSDKETVAVKILKPDVVARNHEYSELFKREAKNARSLAHPHIVKIFDSGEDDELAFMVMEWLEGISVEDIVAQEKVPLDRLINIFEQICSAVASAHKKNIIHLDLKPANILLLINKRPDDFVKVIDFGLSRIISRESGTTVTRFRGTHQYCAPEQFGGRISYKSDIYSLGATLYHLLTGVIPFSTSYINAKLHPNLELPDVPSVTHYRDISDQVDIVIAKALKKDPELRQQSVTELFEEFRIASLEN
jgi:serine/threonine-protein kinase